MSLFATISGFNLGYFVVVESSRWRQETSLRFLLLTGVLQAETFFWPNRSLGNTGGVRKRKKKKYIPCNQAGLLYDIFRQHGLDSLRFCSIIGCASFYSSASLRSRHWSRSLFHRPWLCVQNSEKDGHDNDKGLDSFRLCSFIICASSYSSACFASMHWSRSWFHRPWLCVQNSGWS